MPTRDISAVGARIAGLEMAGVTTPAAANAAADRIFAALRVRLGRWIGKDAYDTLLERALAGARPRHPVLAGPRWRPDADGVSPGADRAVDAAGDTPEAVRAALVATLDELTSLLGRFIGNDLALRLVLQDWEDPAPAGEEEP